MKTRLKRYIRNCVNWVRLPRGLGFSGKGSTFRYPRIVGGREHIRIGTNSYVASQSWIECFSEYAGEKFSPEIVIGNNVRIGRFATVTAISSVKIGDGCLFSEHVYISDHAHDVFGYEHTPLSSRRLLHKGDVSIGDYCFLGFRAIVLPGVTLGDRCVVGAGSVVTKSFPEGSIIAGAPARLIRALNHDK